MEVWIAISNKKTKARASKEGRGTHKSMLDMLVERTIQHSRDETEALEVWVCTQTQAAISKINPPTQFQLCQGVRCVVVLDSCSFPYSIFPASMFPSYILFPYFLFPHSFLVPYSLFRFSIFLYNYFLYPIEKDLSLPYPFTLARPIGS